jgi:hypothetical protein
MGPEQIGHRLRGIAWPDRASPALPGAISMIRLLMLSMIGPYFPCRPGGAASSALATEIHCRGHDVCRQRETLSLFRNPGWT